MNTECRTCAAFMLCLRPETVGWMGCESHTPDETHCPECGGDKLPGDGVCLSCRVAASDAYAAREATVGIRHAEAADGVEFLRAQLGERV
jgi:hypothetical protein